MTSNKSLQTIYYFLLTIILLTIKSNADSSCIQNSKLTTYSGVICQIDYQQCSQNNTFVIDSCVGYKCKLQVQGNCYYYSYQAFTNTRCMRDCCGYTINSTSDYSGQLAQCLSTNSYSNDTGDTTSSPSNKTAIILGCILGGVFFLIVTACICCRNRIKNLVAGNQQPRSNRNINAIQPRHQASIEQINSMDINLILDSTSTQLHYEKEEECTICLSSSNNARTHCSHWFHIDCLAVWLKKSFHCPNCMTEEINPITLFCKQCKKPYAQIKINKYTEPRHLLNSLNSFKCNQCKNLN